MFVHGACISGCGRATMVTWVAWLRTFGEAWFDGETHLPWGDRHFVSCLWCMCLGWWWRMFVSVSRLYMVLALTMKRRKILFQSIVGGSLY